jgi:hypothetical protein
MTVYLHRYNGVLPAGDIFSFGWHGTTTLSLSLSHNNALTWESTFWEGGGGAVGYNTVLVPGVNLQNVTTYQLDTVFPYRTVAVASSDFTDPGLSVANSLPQDVSVVVSLRTDTPGRTGRGRIYLPAPDVTTLTANGELKTATQTNVAFAAQTAFGLVVLAGEVPVIFSRSTGLAKDIIRVGVGTVFDRQSRRVNKVATVRDFLPVI